MTLTTISMTTQTSLVTEPRYLPVAYGLRRDRTLGREEPGNPVLVNVVYSGPVYTHPREYSWSDGTVTTEWSLT